MAEQIGNSGNELTITIPSSGERDWAVSIRDNCFTLISSHDHEGSGTGKKLVGYLALDLTSAIVTNNTNLMSVDNAGTGTVSLIKADASDEVVLPTTIASANFQDDGFTILDNADNTKIVAFDVSGVTTATTRTLTIPDANDTIVGKATTDTLTNKSIDSDNNTITNIVNADIKAAAAIAVDKLAALTASEIVITDGSGFITSAAVATYPSLTELTYLKGVTSAIQTQMDAKISAVTGTSNEITITSSTEVGLADNPVIPGTDSMVVPVGTTAQRSSTTDGAFRFNSTLNQWEGYKSTAWGEIGGGGGGLDQIATQDFETDVATSASSGLNATFGTAGTFDGALSNDTSTEIAGLQSLKYTAGSASTNDWFEVETVTLETKAKGEWLGITIYADMSNFAKNVDFVVLTDEGDVLTTSGTDIFTASASKARYSFAVFMPSTATSFTYGCHMVNAPVNTENFIIDECEITLNPFVYKNLVDTESIIYTGYTSMSTGNVQFKTEQQNTGANLVVKSVTSSATRYTFQKDCNFTAAFSLAYGSAVTEQDSSMSLFNSSDTILLTSISRNEYTAGTGTITGRASTGDYLVVNTSNTVLTDSLSNNFCVTATESSEHVITPAKSNMIDWTAYTPTTQGLGTVSGVEVFYARRGDSLLVNGVMTSGTTTAVEAQISLPTGLTIDSTKFATLRAAGNLWRGAATGGQNHILGTGGDAFVNLGVQDASTAGLVVKDGNVVIGSSQSFSFYFEVPIAEWTSDAVFLAAVPTQLTAYVEDVQPSSTAGGTSSTNTVHTRVLNTLTGDTGFISLDSNQFTLTSGKYEIEWSAPALHCNIHQSHLYDITGSAIEKEGTAEYSDGTYFGYSSSKGNATLTLSASNTYEIKHWVNIGRATDGFGVDSAVGTNNTLANNVFTQVKITKIK